MCPFSYNSKNIAIATKSMQICTKKKFQRKTAFTRIQINEKTTKKLIKQTKYQFYVDVLKISHLSKQKYCEYKTNFAKVKIHI